MVISLKESKIRGWIFYSKICLNLPTMHVAPHFQPPPPTGYPQSAPGAYAAYPVNLPIFSDPEIIKEQTISCLARCPQCNHIGYTLVVNKINICLLILGIIFISVYFLGLILIFLSFERTHTCARCSAEIARKKNLC